LPHRALVADNAARPVEHALAFGREAAKARAAIDQQHAHLFLEVLDAGRKRWLGNPARIGGAPEMPLAGQCQEKLELVDQCVSSRAGLGRVAPNLPSHDRKFRSFDRNCTLVLYQLVRWYTKEKVPRIVTKDR